MENKVEKLIVIMGPTASGKTRLGIELAERLNGEIISGDAFQVYKKLDIGTAKPSMEEQRRVVHHLVNFKCITEGYTVAEFVQLARERISNVLGREKIPIVVGGTGLYIQALLEGYHFSKVGPLRDKYKELEDIYAEKGMEGLIERMNGRDPSYIKTHPVLDKQRVIRALSILESGDDYRTGKQSNTSIYDGPVFALVPPREVLYKRINERVDKMIEIGLEAEAKWLWEFDLTGLVQARKAIGYREWEAYFHGTLPYATVVDHIKRNTRRFAKRQLTWLKRMSYIEYIDPLEYESISQLAESLVPVIESGWRVQKWKQK